ncbi:MAG: nicotinate phosphoribosyltransferase [Chlamydiales bacterium]|nr:nicotinate phosphoribosyltransferase [Chlamydiales bacterium]
MTERAYPHIYRESLALLTDYYQLTMSYGYWLQKLHQRNSVFTMFFRRPPFDGGFTVAAGLQPLIEFIRDFRYSESDLAYLAALTGIDGKATFPEPFLEYLRDLRFTCDIDAVPEGTIVFPYEPLIRVTGPLLQAQLLESPLLNFINFPSLIATKAARVRLAAQNDTILEFGLRRAQGTDGAVTASRAAYVGGCDGTSNVLAGKLFGIPVRGTHSHSWVMVFDDESKSFEAFAQALPAGCVFLVDTYNSVEGIRRAIERGVKLRQQGYELGGVRLDSGDLTYLSVKAREMLDEAGFPKATIVASNELDERLIAEMKNQGARVNVWGVGTNLVTGQDSPALDGVYKLSAIQEEDGKWQYKLKLSEQMRKVSNPGVLQIARFSRDGEHVADVIYDQVMGLPEACAIVDPLDPTRQRVLGRDLEREDLLIPIMRKGELVYDLPALSDIRTATNSNLRSFHPGILRFVNPHQYVVGMEKGLYDLKVNLIAKIRQGQAAKIVAP